jgi:hypothetical protein
MMELCDVTIGYRAPFPKTPVRETATEGGSDATHAS